MRFCENHWGMLREKVDAAGLGTLVPETAEKAMAGLVDQIETDKTTVDNFDPLMGAHNAIVANGLDMVGLDLMQPNEDGSERCPICYLTAYSQKWRGPNDICTCGCGERVPNFEEWLDLAVAGQVEVWKAMQL